MNSIPSDTVDEVRCPPAEEPPVPGSNSTGTPPPGVRGEAGAAPESRRARAARVGLFLLVSAWVLPGIDVVVRAAPVPEGFRFLDPSWRVAVPWALARGLAWGREIVFTYGPLGFLRQNTLVEVGLFRLSVLFELGVYALWVAALYGFTRAIGLGLGWTAAFAAALLVLPIPSLDLLGPILLLLLMFLALCCPPGTSGGTSPWIVAGVGFLAALLSLIKLSLFVAAAALVGLFAVAVAASPLEAPSGERAWTVAVLRKRVRRAAWILGSYVGSLLVLWIAARQPLGALDDFLVTGWEIVSGYTPAMGLVHFHRFTALGLGSATLLPILGTAFLLSFVVFLAEALHRMRAGAIDLPVLFLLVGSLGLAFIAFKHGFVRFDGHVSGFLSTAGLLGLLSVAVSRTRLAHAIPNGRAPASALAVAGLGVLAVAAFFAGFPGNALRPGIVRHTDELRQAAVLLVDGERAQALVEEQKARLRSAYGGALPATLRESVGEQSVDVLPWDVALLWATDLDWTPRPVFHSYATFTARLDALNARFFRETPPEYIVYRHLAVDGQHPMYSNPLTMRAILGGYEPASDPGGGFLLLRRSRDPAEHGVESLATTTAGFGERIPVPDAGGRVYARIRIRYSLPGRVMNTLYRPGRLHIQLFGAAGETSRRYRLVADPARNGLLVSENADRAAGFAALLSGADAATVTAFELTTEEPSHYRPEIVVEFVRSTRADPARATGAGKSGG